MALTALAIKNAKPRERQYKLADERALCLLVTPAGGKYWRMHYRILGKDKTLSLGVWPDVSLAQAREKRDEARKRIVDGIDPQAEKKVASLRAQIDAAITFKAVADEWLLKIEREGRAERTLGKVRWLLNMAYPLVGSRPIDQIEVQEVLAVLRRIEATGRYESARRMRSVAGRVFRYGIATGRCQRDIASDLRGAIVVPKVRHFAAITRPKEVGELMRAIDDYPGHAITTFALRMTPHVFVRPGELRKAEWREFDLDRAVWSIPAEKMKMRWPHQVPLSRQVLTLLAELRPLTGHSSFVFPAFHTWKRSMSENTITFAPRRMGYALPLTEIANVRASLLGSGAPAGRFFALHGLATAKDRFVTTPNADTIYSIAFIDLREGPATLTVPPLGDRYASLALMDMFSDNFAVLGERNTGQDGGTFTLAGPTAAAPAGAIRSPTPWVWAMARVVVNGPDDVAAARALLHRFGCDALPARSWAPGAERTGSWAAWFRAANALMIENPAPATDRRMLRRMEPLGLGRADFDPARFTAGEGEAIEAGIADAIALTRSIGFGGREVGGWVYPAANTGNFFQDYVGRARIAIAGLAALPPTEATYLAAIPSEGRLFDGDEPRRLRFEEGQLPPVDAFWSLTMYEAQSDGAFLLTENSIDRYTIGDRTPGLVRNSDGSLDIWIARTSPGDDRAANWLPAPARGPFLVILRAYLPRAEITAQNYVPPAIEQI